jgi:hypothetical protein
MVIRRVIYSKNKLGFVACSSVTGIAADAGGVSHTCSLALKRSVSFSCVTFPSLHYPDSPYNLDFKRNPLN